VKDSSDSKITHYVATITDITERKKTEEHINRLAFYDPLTQLPNRRLLNERMKYGIESCRRKKVKMAVLMLDLDKFKPVNDKFGHATGDELLQQVTRRIKSRLRENDMVSRFGGDEFVILIEEVQQLTAIMHIAEDIIRIISLPFELNPNLEVQIGVSIGISICPEDGQTTDMLLKKADTAMYKAKEEGRGCFAFY
jgi:diguanylate cyclase (GGDEF)-like protein